MCNEDQDPEHVLPPVSQVSSQTSSVSSCDDYIILPDCFDTSRPLFESMYGSAMSQPVSAAVISSDVPQEKDSSSTPPSGRQEQKEEVNIEESSVDTWPPTDPPICSSVNRMLCASQTLDTVPLTPEVVSPLVHIPDPLLRPPTLYSPRLDQSNRPFDQQKSLIKTILI